MFGRARTRQSGCASSDFAFRQRAYPTKKIEWNSFAQTDCRHSRLRRLVGAREREQLFITEYQADRHIIYLSASAHSFSLHSSDFNETQRIRPFFFVAAFWLPLCAISMKAIWWLWSRFWRSIPLDNLGLTYPAHLVIISWLRLGLDTSSVHGMHHHRRPTMWEIFPQKRKGDGRREVREIQKWVDALIFDRKQHATTQRKRDNFGRNGKLWKIIILRVLGWDARDGMPGTRHASECEQ